MMETYNLVVHKGLIPIFLLHHILIRLNIIPVCSC